jgi:hypothetical protein
MELEVKSPVEEDSSCLHLMGMCSVDHGSAEAEVAWTSGRRSGAAAERCQKSHQRGRGNQK